MKLLLLLLWVGVAQAQTTSQNQLGVLSSSDTTLRNLALLRQYDFYYSAKQAEVFIKTSMASYTQEDRLKKNRFWDKVYTQVVPEGSKVPEPFDDYVLIGSGKIDAIRPDGEW